MMVAYAAEFHQRAVVAYAFGHNHVEEVAYPALAISPLEFREVGEANRRL
jgi:hypothetical protein